jgi:signal transduction histidine kinase
MVGALVTADRALNSASREAASVDAMQSSQLIEQALSHQVAALGSLRPALIIAGGDRGRVLQQLATELVHEAPSLRELWVADTSGRAVYATSTARQPAPSGKVVPTVGIDTSRNVVFDVPLALNGRSLGTVVARFEASGLFRGVLSSVPETRVRFVLLVGADTIVASGAHRGDASLTWRHADVRAYGAVWELRVAHAQRSQVLRITLWTLGLVAVLIFGAGVLRERRQALRVAERSSELERLSSELLRANRMKSEFLANVSHELRTPLNAIVGFVDLLRDGVYGDLSPRQAPPVERIAASATHLRHLVDQVLDIAKIAAGRLEVHAETIVLRPFVLNVVSELEPLINERGLNLSIAVGSSLPRVRTDPTHLRQILVNLIGNAVKYTPAGGIAVRARLTGLPPAAGAVRPTPSEDPALLSRSPDRRRTWIALQVIDTGIGISPSDQERIFDEFEQVNAGPRGDSMERGTGLGLAISRRLARLLGGEISVESQPGKGSTFTIWLPVSPADIQAEPPGATAAPQQAAV